MAKQMNKQPKNWADEDLVSWALGETAPGKEISEEALAEEAFRRMEREQGTVGEAKELLRGAVEEKEEVTPVDSDEAPVEETPAPQKQEAQTPAPQKTPAPQGNSVAAQGIKESLDKYINIMQPGQSHSGNEGAVAQVKLYRAIRAVLRTEGREFIEAYGLMLQIVHEHREDVFHERYLFRYFGEMRLTAPEQRNFERILNLIITTANPKVRSKSVHEVDLDLTMEGFRDPAMHQRVTEFYEGV